MNIISLGLGQQSTAIYFMSSFGDLPRADYAIFADPKAEKKETYEYLKWLLQWQKDNNGIPIVIVEKDLKNELVNPTYSRFSSIPLFTKNADGTSGMLKRQCTSNFKIVPIHRTIRELQGTVNSKPNPVIIWMGISAEEMHRMNNPRVNYITHYFPLVGFKLTKKDYSRDKNAKMYSRGQCVQYLLDKGLPVPPKSACWFCPFQGSREWLKLKSDKAAWAEAIQLDSLLRNSTQKGVKQPAFLHSSLKPLAEVNFNENQIEMFDDGGGCMSAFCNT